MRGESVEVGQFLHMAVLLVDTEEVAGPQVLRIAAVVVVVLGPVVVGPVEGPRVGADQLYSVVEDPLERVAAEMTAAIRVLLSAPELVIACVGQRDVALFELVGHVHGFQLPGDFG